MNNKVRLTTAVIRAANDEYGGLWESKNNITYTTVDLKDFGYYAYFAKEADAILFTLKYVK